MRNNRSKTATNKTVVVVLTADPAFEQSVHTTFSAATQIDLRVVAGTISSNEEMIEADDATVRLRQMR